VREKETNNPKITKGKTTIGGEKCGRTYCLETPENSKMSGSKEQIEKKKKGDRKPLIWALANKKPIGHKVAINGRQTSPPDPPRRGGEHRDSRPKFLKITDWRKISMENYKGFGWEKGKEIWGSQMETKLIDEIEGGDS